MLASIMWKEERQRVKSCYQRIFGKVMAEIVERVQGHSSPGLGNHFWEVIELGERTSEMRMIRSLF